MTNKKLDKLYDAAEFLIKNEQWSIIDDLLEFYANSAWRQDIDLLIAWATLTLCARKKFKNRSYFIKSCKKFYNDPKLWKGL